MSSTDFNLSAFLASKNATKDQFHFFITNSIDLFMKPAIDHFCANPSELQILEYLKNNLKQKLITELPTMIDDLAQATLDRVYRKGDSDASSGSSTPPSQRPLVIDYSPEAEVEHNSSPGPSLALASEAPTQMAIVSQPIPSATNRGTKRPLNGLQLMPAKFTINWFSCPVVPCPLKLITLADLHHHMIERHGTLPFSCPANGCPVTTETRGDILHHMHRNHSSHGIWRCRYCRYMTMKPSKYLFHQFLNHQHGQFQCTRCNKIFGFQSYAFDHISAHK